mmetsp:Transcript_26908/g.41254  ORF Transcript_26908/g.41254 Transcript_26908/m.41254 type:complete len:120 (+) Transcript_26908:79-438(+)
MLSIIWNNNNTEYGSYSTNSCHVCVVGCSIRFSMCFVFQLWFWGREKQNIQTIPKRPRAAQPSDAIDPPNQKKITLSLNLNPFTRLLASSLYPVVYISFATKNTTAEPKTSASTTGSVM